MKKSALSALVVAAVCASTAAQAEPSRLFSQETANLSKDVSVDLNYFGGPGGFAAGIRAGAFGGEVLVNSKGAELDGSGLASSNAGFKMGVGKGIAVYGLLAYSKTQGATVPPAPAPAAVTTTDFALGAAYTMQASKDLMINANAEIVTDDTPPGNPAGTNGRGGKNTLFVKLGAGYTMAANANGKFTFIGEAIMENSDFLDTTLNLGVRWEPRKNATIDFVLLNDRGDGGSNLGIPGGIRANFAF